MTRDARLLVSCGLLGAAVAVFDLLTPPAVGPERWSYPHTATVFVLTEIPIVTSHVLTALGIVSVVALVGPGGYRGTRVRQAGRAQGGRNRGAVIT